MDHFLDEGISDALDICANSRGFPHAPRNQQVTRGAFLRLLVHPTRHRGSECPRRNGDHANAVAPEVASHREGHADECAFGGGIRDLTRLAFKLHGDRRAFSRRKVTGHDTEHERTAAELPTMTTTTPLSPPGPSGGTLTTKYLQANAREIELPRFQPARCAGLMAVASGIGLIQVHDGDVSFLLKNASDSGKSENLKTLGRSS
ncbi:hypothetical protein BC826DRAFT_1173878 [Russula brevipes]|nr:hypothetical protein BC826DRAFT_1173878 [Russula brevipes]